MNEINQNVGHLVSIINEYKGEFKNTNYLGSKRVYAMAAYLNKQAITPGDLRQAFDRLLLNTDQWPELSQIMPLLPARKQPNGRCTTCKNTGWVYVKGPKWPTMQYTARCTCQIGLSYDNSIPDYIQCEKDMRYL